MATEILQRSAVEQAAHVRAGDVSARELVEAALAAIDARDARLNAFVTMCAERALAEAEAIGPGDPRPLAGVPIAIKDLIVLTEGVRTTHASRAMGDWIPDRDSVVVARLRGAGAIMVGKTNTPEFGMRPVTEPERFGPSRNPWDPDFTPGGSSGGSAAAVAGGLLALAHGNDAGGSIRIPASCCGVVGLKAARRRTPLGADLSEFDGFSLDGVLTRDVLDTAVALDVIAGDEAGGGETGPPPPVISFPEAARRAPGRLPVRVCERPAVDIPVDPDCADAARAAGRLLEGLGHDVEEGAPDWEDAAFQRSWETAGGATFQALVDACGRLRGAPLDPEQLEPSTREALAAPVGPETVDEAMGALQRYARRIVEPWPQRGILVTPTMARTVARVGELPPEEGVRCSAFVRVFNVTGQPAISLPLHRDARGLPVGVQLVGPPGGEALLLSLAAQIEAAAPWPRLAPAG